MSRRIVSGMMLTLLLIGMLTLAFNIQPVEAGGTVYIRADGSVEPDTAPISTVDNVTYTFTDNIYDEIVVERDNIVVDGAGYTVQGTGNGTGIYLLGRSNVTIKNTEIKAFHYGIRLDTSSNNSISGNNITNNYRGIELYWYCNYNSISGNNITANKHIGIKLYRYCNYNNISGNSITNNSVGIRLCESSNNTINGNNITNNWEGVCLEYSSNHVLRNNSMAGNSYSFGVSGSALSEFIHDVDVSNTVDGKPVYYLINQKNLVIDPSTYPNVGYLALINSTNITVKGLELKNNGQGILFANTKDSQITNNNITANNREGIRLYHSGSNTVSGNSITNNGDGIRLDESSNNTICENNITANNWWGIPLLNSSNYNTISGNNITANEYSGIDLYWYCNYNTISGNDITANKENGIELDDSSNNIISGNTITSNKYGIWIDDFSNNNTICGNTVTCNAYGILLDESSNNTLRNNDAYNNKYNFDVYGSLLSHYIHDIDDSNIVNGKPVYYWVNRQDMAVPLDAGYAALVNCTRMAITNLNLANNGQGVLLAFTTNSTITKNNITNNAYGISLYHSSYNIISGNSITNNYYVGISLEWMSDGNTFTGNTISENLVGLSLRYSTGNIVYHNNFVDNLSYQGYSYASTTFWDRGYPCGGNYWSDHVCTGNPSDGSQPYITFYTWDDYPFQHPNGWLLNQLTVTSSPTTGITFTINETPQTTPYTEWLPEGSYTLEMPEIHAVEDARCYWNQWSDGNTSRSRTVTMTTDITLTADYTGPYHLYDLNRNGIVDIADLVLAAIAFGSYPGHPSWNPIADVNDDGYVDVRDMVIIALHFGETI